MKKFKKSSLALIITLAITFCISVLNWMVASNSGDVKIKRLYILGDDGLTYSALMYVPSNATDDDPAPAVIMYHGNSGNARNHESWSLEFARRGYVALAIDWNGSGDGESYGNVQAEKPYWNARNIAEIWLKYLMTVPCVDNTRIIASGHSSGASHTAALATKYDLPAALLASGTGGANSLGEYNGALLMTVGSADIDALSDALANMAVAGQAMGFLSETDEVELGKLYGSFEDGKTFKCLRIPNQVHEAAFINTGTIEALLDFAQTAVAPPNPIPGSEQVWMWKDVLGQLGMFALVAVMISAYLFLADQIPALACLKQPVPRNIGVRGFGLVLAIVITVGVPLLIMKTSAFGVISLMDQSKLFPIIHPNKALAIIVGGALAGLVMLVLFWFLVAKKENATWYDMGLGSAETKKLDFVLIFKALLTSVAVFLFAWSLLNLQLKYLGTDFYCLFWGYKPLCAEKAASYLPYVILWVLSYIVVNIGINVEKRLPDTGKPWLDMLVAIVFNVVVSGIAVAAMVFIQNQMQLAGDGTISGQALANWKIDISRLWGMPVGITIGMTGNTILYRKTGSIWAGTFLMGIVCALGCVLYGYCKIV